jgi:hypothetical protein
MLDYFAYLKLCGMFVRPSRAEVVITGRKFSGTVLEAGLTAVLKAYIIFLFGLPYLV